MNLGAFQKWLGAFSPEDPLRLVSNTTQRNRLTNVLADLRGVGCRVHKPTNAEGLGWRIIFDGGTDMAPPGYVPPIVTDRQFAVGDTDNPGTYREKVSGYDSVAFDSDDIAVRYDVYSAQARPHVKTAGVDTTGAAVYVLGKLADGSLVWVPTTDTCG